MAAVATPLEGGTPDKKKNTADWSWSWEDVNNTVDNIHTTVEKVGGVIEQIGDIFDNKDSSAVPAASAASYNSGSFAISPLFLVGAAALLLLK